MELEFEWEKKRLKKREKKREEMKFLKSRQREEIS